MWLSSPVLGISSRMTAVSGSIVGEAVGFAVPSLCLISLRIAGSGVISLTLAGSTNDRMKLQQNLGDELRWSLIF